RISNHRFTWEGGSWPKMLAILAINLLTVACSPFTSLRSNPGGRDGLTQTPAWGRNASVNSSFLRLFSPTTAPPGNTHRIGSLLTDCQFGCDDVPEREDVLRHTLVLDLLGRTDPHNQHFGPVELELVGWPELPGFGDPGDVHPQFLVGVLLVPQE